MVTRNLSSIKKKNTFLIYLIWLNQFLSYLRIKKSVSEFQIVAELTQIKVHSTGHSASFWHHSSEICWFDYKKQSGNIWEVVTKRNSPTCLLLAEFCCMWQLLLIKSTKFPLTICLKHPMRLNTRVLNIFHNFIYNSRKSFWYLRRKQRQENKKTYDMAHVNISKKDVSWNFMKN